MADKETRVSPSSPLAACGAILAGLALVGLAEGYERTRAAPEIVESVAEPAPDAGVSDAGTPEVERLLEGRRLDLNRASAEELELLPRIGPTLARRIVEDRERRGPFRTVQELSRVRGIGPRTMEGIAPLATVDVTDP